MDAGPTLAGGDLLGLAAALGGALLIGLERERRKRRGPERKAAGIRSFALAGFCGGLAQLTRQPLLVALGALAVALLASAAYWRSQQHKTPDADPGLTTELALFVTYLVGVLAVQQPALGAAAAAIVAGLLAARERLHRFATQMLSEAELHDALLLAALALVLLPLAPAQPLAWLGGLAPRTLLMLTLLILALQAAGHVALRLFGPRAGLALAGLMSGLVSSTATIAAMGARSRATPAAAAACEAGAMMSTAATWLLALLMLAALSPPSALALLPAAAAGATLALTSGLLRLRAAPALPPEAVAAPGQGPLRPREAVLVALLLAVVALGVAWAQTHFGVGGVLAGSALAALADAHAPVAALGARAAAGLVEPGLVRDAALVAVATNAVTRSITAWVAGGRGYGLRVAGSLLLSTAGALGAMLVFR
ncbi:conserved membrane hypothetical protein [Rubrivivax sp. A210]|uniref:DUF4010 domain-containing protein n=1 Tax=Rubrivivax sp. A210 TaxID=2772301 RepID=UPI001918CAB9|nr:DUF4010 domain-containing protein [Rubrivivax sp. A210]CAD5373608.1 conserved membrane hypothetical protein [Rubrivivax sp. A210]